MENNIVNEYQRQAQWEKDFLTHLLTSIDGRSAISNLFEILNLCDEFEYTTDPSVVLLDLLNQHLRENLNSPLSKVFSNINLIANLLKFTSQLREVAYLFRSETESLGLSIAQWEEVSKGE